MVDPTAYTTLYFGYASNLSPRTISQRCPDSLFISLATLRGWKWIICSTGYANIVRTNDDNDVVWGSLSFLTRRDEISLDDSEGVPVEYEKARLKVRRIGALKLEGAGAPQTGIGPVKTLQDDGQGDLVEALVYVNHNKTEEGRMEKGYTVMVRKAIEDAINFCGMPRAYADQYIERFIREVIGNGHDKDDAQSQDAGLGPEQVMMVRTTRFDNESAPPVPRNLANWTRG